MKADRGQALAFGALTLFLLSCFVALVFNVGAASSRKVELQTAADEGAYAGAVALADTLSEIAWLNDAQAHLYYQAMRLAVDVVVYGVLAELEEHGAEVGGPPCPNVGVSDAVGRYNDAYDEAGTQFAEIDRWVKNLAQMQWALAAWGPSLVRREIFRAIHDSLGVDPVQGSTDLQVAIYPDFTLLPDPNGDFKLLVRRYSQGPPTGWFLATHPGQLWWAEALIVGPEEWTVRTSDGLDVRIQHPTPTRYVIYSSAFVPTPGNPLTMDFYSGVGWVAQMPGFTIRPGPHGGIEIQGGGQPGEFRRGPDGQLQQWNGSGWEDLAGQSVVVDGVEIPIVQNGIQIGQDFWIDFSPLRIRAKNIVIWLGSNIRIEADIGPARVTADQDYVVVNDLSTRTADGVWRRLGGDRTIHRMRRGPIREEGIGDSETWLYEWKHIGGYLAQEPNGRRFGLENAIFDNDPAGLVNPQPCPDWTYDAVLNPSGWFNPATGLTLDDKAYHQTRVCWHPDDLSCPKHGAACTGPPVPEVPPLQGLDGGWHDAIGNWVACPICTNSAGDKLDDDGDLRSDVRKYQLDTYDRQPPDRPRYQSVQIVNAAELFRPLPPPPVPRELLELRVPKPLVLTEEFFKFGVNVAVWRRGDATGQGTSEFRLFPNLFQLPAGFTGRVAFASAKCGLRDPASGRYLYRFDGPDEATRLSLRAGWVANHPDNLYQADWEARLWSVKDAIRDEDLYNELDEVRYTTDSGLQFLFRGFLSTAWLTRYDDVQPVWNLPGGMGLDLLDRRMLDVVRH